MVFGDDAFGVEVARRLSLRALPEGVHVVDFGIRGIDLTYALLDPYVAVILVDAVPRGGPPGTLYVIQPKLDRGGEADAASPLIEPHALDPVKVLHLARSLGGQVERVLVVGCEPAPSPPDDDPPMEMSESVQLAVEEAVPLIESFVTRIRGDARR